MVIRITRELLNFNSVESQKPFLPNLMLRMYKILSQYPHQLKVMHIQSYLDVSDSQKFCGKQIFPNLANGTNSLFTFPKYFEYQNQSFPYENHHRTLKKNLHEDCDSCYLLLQIFFLYIHSPPLL